jgi:alkylation response protein AidB-like acyl-CoA dehydrogenase
MPDGGTDTAFLEVARAFRPRIIAQSDRIEAARRLPEDVARELARAGFFRMFLPKAYGGLDLTPMAVIEILEELARAERLGRMVRVERQHSLDHRPAPARGCASCPRRTGCHHCEQHARLGAGPNGRRRVPSKRPMVAGERLRTERLDDPTVRRPMKTADRASRHPARPKPIHAAPLDGVRDHRHVDGGGLRGTGSHDVVVHDEFVPSSYRSSFTDPFVLAAPRYRIPPFSRVIPGLGAMPLGMARIAMETLTEIAVDKQLQRTSQILRENHCAQIRVSQAEALVRSVR